MTARTAAEQRAYAEGLEDAAKERAELRRVLTNIANWRKLCLDYDKDMGNDPRTFCEDVELIEQTAQVALKNAAQAAPVKKRLPTAKEVRGILK